jgi:hypothetical protein
MGRAALLLVGRLGLVLGGRQGLVLGGLEGLAGRQVAAAGRKGAVALKGALKSYYCMYVGVGVAMVWVWE